MPKGNTKNIRYPSNIEDLFDNNIPNLDGEELLEPVFEIDTESIDKEANILASGILANVAKVYASETFLNDHPDFRKRLDSELQSLKMHYKMRSVDEKIQDELIKAIGRKADNASLYVALTKLQAQMTSTQNKIDATMDRIQTLLKSYQTELNFEDDLDDEEAADASSNEDNYNNTPFILKKTSSRGSKNFIDEFKQLSLEDLEEERIEG